MWEFNLGLKIYFLSHTLHSLEKAPEKSFCIMWLFNIMCKKELPVLIHYTLMYKFIINKMKANYLSVVFSPILPYTLECGSTMPDEVLFHLGQVRHFLFSCPGASIKCILTHLAYIANAKKRVISTINVIGLKVPRKRTQVDINCNCKMMSVMSLGKRALADINCNCKMMSVMGLDIVLSFLPLKDITNTRKPM